MKRRAKKCVHSSFSSCVCSRRLWQDTRASIKSTGVAWLIDRFVHEGTDQKSLSVSLSCAPAHDIQEEPRKTGERCRFTPTANCLS